MRFHTAACEILGWHGETCVPGSVPASEACVGASVGKDLVGWTAEDDNVGVRGSGRRDGARKWGWIAGFDET